MNTIWSLDLPEVRYQTTLICKRLDSLLYSAKEGLQDAQAYAKHRPPFVKGGNPVLVVIVLSEYLPWGDSEVPVRMACGHLQAFRYYKGDPHAGEDQAEYQAERCDQCEAAVYQAALEEEKAEQARDEAAFGTQEP